MEQNEIHIGNIIKSVYNTRGITIAQFATMLNCKRSNVYDIFNRKSIDTDLLLKISDILKFDFINEIYLHRKGQAEIDPESPYKINFTFEVPQSGYKKFLKSIKCLEIAGFIVPKDDLNILKNKTELKEKSDKQE